MLYTVGVLSSLREVIAKRSFLPLIRHSRTSSRMPPSLEGRLGESADVTLGFLCDTSAGSFRLLLRKIHLPPGGRQKERRYATRRGRLPLLFFLDIKCYSHYVNFPIKSLTY